MMDRPDYLFFSPLLNRFQSLKTGNASRTCTLDVLLEDIRSSVENILNTRVPILWEYFLSSPSTRLDDSLLNYGMIDYCNVTEEDASREERFKKSVKRALYRHEPRITVDSISVRLNKSAATRTINIEINGGLNVAPRRPVKFLAGLKGTNQKIDVKRTT